MFVTGPDVIKTVTHEEVSKNELGGAMTHNTNSGVGAFSGARRCRMPVDDSRAALLHAVEQPRRSAAHGLYQIPSIVPMQQLDTTGSGRSRTCPMTSRTSFTRIVDDSYFFEVQEHFAKNLVIGFARLDGRPVGIVANQPAVLAGVLDINASDERRALCSLLRRFNIPLVTFEDVPGFLPGTEQEFGGIISARGQTALRFCRGDRAEVTVITRKAYGGAYCVMASKHIRTDVNFAWPTAEIAVMGPEGAVNIVYKREFDRAPKRRTAPREGALAKLRNEKVDEFRERFANPYIAAERGYVDSVIRPRETRRRVIQALEMLDTKRDKNPPRKHGNIPL